MSWRFFRGDVFYLLDSHAEGFHRVWHYGDTLVIDALCVGIRDTRQGCGENAEEWACAENYPSETWWSRVRARDGLEGWVVEPLDDLEGVLVQ